MISYEDQTLSIYLNKYYVSLGKRVDKSNGKFFLQLYSPRCGPLQQIGRLDFLRLACLRLAFCLQVYKSFDSDSYNPRGVVPSNRLEDWTSSDWPASDWPASDWPSVYKFTRVLTVTSLYS